MPRDAVQGASGRAPRDTPRPCRRIERCSICRARVQPVAHDARARGLDRGEMELAVARPIDAAAAGLLGEDARRRTRRAARRSARRPPRPRSRRARRGDAGRRSARPGIAASLTRSISSSVDPDRGRRLPLARGERPAARRPAGPRTRDGPSSRADGPRRRRSRVRSSSAARSSRRGRRAAGATTRCARCGRGRSDRSSIGRGHLSRRAGRSRPSASSVAWRRRSALSSAPGTWSRAW